MPDYEIISKKIPIKILLPKHLLDFLDERAKKHYGQAKGYRNTELISILTTLYNGEEVETYVRKK